jgi:hypothetical protein
MKFVRNFVKTGPQGTTQIMGFLFKFLNVYRIPLAFLEGSRKWHLTE